jgi:predicted phosphodiesterase
VSAPPRWRLGVVSDAHLSPATAEPYIWQNTVDLPHSAELLDAGIGWLAEQAIDTLVLLGDLTEAADPASFAAIRERAISLGVAVAAVPGNCDVDPKDRSLSGFEAIVGDRVFTGPGLFGFGADWMLELLQLEAAGPKQLRGVRHVEAGVSQYGARVVLTHYPVLDLEPELLAAGFRHSGNLANRAEIEADLRALEMPVVVIHGHLHIHDARSSGNLLHLSCGALIEPPHHVSTIEIATDDDGITIERRAHVVREDPTDRLPVFAPSHQRWAWSGSSWGTLPALP